MRNFSKISTIFSGTTRINFSRISQAAIFISKRSEIIHSRLFLRQSPPGRTGSIYSTRTRQIDEFSYRQHGDNKCDIGRRPSTFQSSSGYWLFRSWRSRGRDVDSCTSEMALEISQSSQQAGTTGKVHIRFRFTGFGEKTGHYQSPITGRRAR